LTNDIQDPDIPDTTAFSTRPEQAHDIGPIHGVHRAAFAAPGEPRLVDDLRAAGMHLASHIALEDGRTVGHALYSRMWVDTDDGPIEAVALGPIAVVPERQGRGIGSALIRAGLAVIRERGERFILVLGHPSYYPRFGFEPSVAETIVAPWSGPPWMGLRLSGEPISGSARYPEAWSRLDEAEEA